MKSIFILFVTLGFLLNIGGKVFVYVDFYLNQEYIAKNLCENKDKPVLKCNGKCHLAKELAKEEKKEKKEDKQMYKDTTLYFFCEIEPLTTVNPVFFEKRAHINAQVLSQCVGYHASVFHPPTLA